jgi:hypothetical protein
MKLQVLGLLGLLLLSVSCGHRRDAKAFEKILEATTGQEHSVAKLHTETGDYVVFLNESTGVYTAYNMEKFDRKEMKTFGAYLANATDGVDIVRHLEKFEEYIESGYWAGGYWENETYYYEEYDWECDCYYESSYTESYYVEPYYVDTSYWYTYFTGGGFRFDNTSGLSKDLEMIAAVEEASAQKIMATKLQSDFSLSSDRAKELSGLWGKYQKLETNRGLTTEEKDQLALNSLGVSMTQLERAMKEKDQSQKPVYEDLLKVAARVNKTTPEQMDKILDEVGGMIVEE